MKRIPKIKIASGYFESESDFDALPKAEGVQVRRLDEQALLVESHIQQNPILSFLLSAGIFAFCIVMYFSITGWPKGLEDRLSGGMFFMLIVGFLSLLGSFVGFVYFLYVLFIKS